MAGFEQIRHRTDRLAELLTRSLTADVATEAGAQLRLRLNDRPGLSLHPLQDAGISTLPDYAEATISPVEGSSNGTIVLDGSAQGWGYVLRKPLILTVKNGRRDKGTSIIK